MIRPGVAKPLEPADPRSCRQPRAAVTTRPGGLTAFFDELIATVKNVDFGGNSVGSALATYDFVSNTIRVNHVENIERGINTIIHESVHALDDARNWTPALRPVSLERVEGVGYTAAALLNRDDDLYLLKSIREFESLLMDPGANETALRNGWKHCVLQLQSFVQSVQIDVAGLPLPITVPGLTPNSRSGTNEDVQAVKEDVGLWFNMTVLMEVYQLRLDARAATLTLDATFVEGPDSWSIPNVFLN